MGGIIEDINEGGITMAFLYLNDWSMKGEGNLSSQWSKVERWYGLMTHLSDTYGIAKIGVPHDFKTRELCGYQLSLCYNPSDETLAEEKKQLLLNILTNLVSNIDTDETISKVYNDSGIYSTCISLAHDQEASVVSFTFDGKYEQTAITGVVKSDGKKDTTCQIKNLFDSTAVSLDYIVPLKECAQHKAMDEPMWNHEMMEAYCTNIGHEPDRTSASTGEKVAYLRKHGRILAEMNGWVYDVNKTKLNHDDEHQRIIFHSGRFRNDDCYLSIDFEKEDFHFELLNHRGKHLREINWHGDKTGDADSSHDIRLKR